MQAAAGVPPAIKEPKPAGANKGLVDCLADIPRGCYADVIVQVSRGCVLDPPGLISSRWSHSRRAGLDI